MRSRPSRGTSMGDMIQRLVEITEQWFDCSPGLPMCFFELPQRYGDDIRLVYVTYVIRGPALLDLEQWMIENVIIPLAEKTDGEGKLWWRLPQYYEVTLEQDQLYTLRTRIAVTDKRLNVVTLPDVLKVEGQPCPTVLQ